MPRAAARNVVARALIFIGVNAVLSAWPSTFVGGASKSAQGFQRLSSALRASSDDSPQVSAPPGFKPPTPQPLALSDGADLFSLLTASLALAIRLASGVFVLGWSPKFLFGDAEAGKYGLKLGPITLQDSSPILLEAPRPKESLILYEYESSPFCRKVREAGQLLDLNIEMRPCPGARAGFARELKERTGRMTVPYLVDPNTGKEMFESEDIIDYMVKEYGPDESKFDANALWTFRGGFAMLSGSYAALARGMPCSQPQANARPDNVKMKPLEFWGYEASPFCRPVREKLCALCLPHVIVPCSRGSRNRQVVMEQTGSQFQVPRLVDPNTGVDMFESPAILEYLEQVYTVAA